METAPRERCSTPWMEKQSPSVLFATQCFLRQYLQSSSRALVILNASKGRQAVLCAGRAAQQQQGLGQPLAEGAEPWQITAMQCFLTAVWPSA